MDKVHHVISALNVVFLGGVRLRVHFSAAPKAEVKVLTDTWAGRHLQVQLIQSELGKKTPQKPPKNELL